MEPLPALPAGVALHEDIVCDADPLVSKALVEDMTLALGNHLNNVLAWMSHGLDTVASVDRHVLAWMSHGLDTVASVDRHETRGTVALYAVLVGADVKVALHIRAARRGAAGSCLYCLDRGPTEPFLVLWFVAASD